MNRRREIEICCAGNKKKRQRSCRSRRNPALLPVKYSSTGCIAGQDKFCGSTMDLERLPSALGEPNSGLFVASLEEQLQDIKQQ
jgi:hypothetical protein